MKRGLNIKRLSHSEDAPCRSLDTDVKGNLTELVRPLGAAFFVGLRALLPRYAFYHNPLRPRHVACHELERGFLAWIEPVGIYVA